MGGVAAIADSGTVADVTAIIFFTFAPVLVASFLSVEGTGSASSSILKLGLDFATLRSGSVSFLNPNCPPNCPLRSTVTKLVRTFESGLGEVPLLPPPAR